MTIGMISKHIIYNNVTYIHNSLFRCCLSVMGQTVQIKHVTMGYKSPYDIGQYRTRKKNKGTTGITSIIREHYLSYVLLPAKQMCWQV